MSQNIDDCVLALIWNLAVGAYLNFVICFL